MICQHCGKELPDDRTYCTGCGARILSASEREYNARRRELELPPEQRISKKNSADFIAIVIGALLVYLSIKGSGILAVFGFILIAAGIFAPKKSNFCDNCKSPKDFTAKTCPHCGRRFTVPAGNVAGGIICAMIASAVYFMVTL